MGSGSITARGRFADLTFIMNCSWKCDSMEKINCRINSLPLRMSSNPLKNQWKLNSHWEPTWLNYILEVMVSPSAVATLPNYTEVILYLVITLHMLWWRVEYISGLLNHINSLKWHCYGVRAENEIQWNVRLRLLTTRIWMICECRVAGCDAHNTEKVVPSTRANKFDIQFIFHSAID